MSDQTPNPIPVAWLDGDPQRIVLHWTGGGYQPNADDLSAYHLLIDGDGIWRRGQWPISASDAPKPGRYAAHVRGLNTGSIGVAICAMGGARERPFSVGPYPIRPAQWAALYAGCAQLATHFRIPVARHTLLSHAEVQPTLGVTQSAKWDIAIDPDSGELAAGGPVAVGDIIRERVQDWTAATDRPLPTPTAQTGIDPRDLPRISAILPDAVLRTRLRELQRMVGVPDADIDGIIGPQTYRAIAAAVGGDKR